MASPTARARYMALFRKVCGLDDPRGGFIGRANRASKQVPPPAPRPKADTAIGRFLK